MVLEHMICSNFLCRSPLRIYMINYSKKLCNSNREAYFRVTELQICNTSNESLMAYGVVHYLAHSLVSNYYYFHLKQSIILYLQSNLSYDTHRGYDSYLLRIRMAILPGNLTGKRLI